MAVQQTPAVNNWYVNKTGKPMKVRLVMVGDQGPEKILLEYLDHSRTAIDIEAWNCLDLDILWQEQIQNQNQVNH